MNRATWVAILTIGIFSGIVYLLTQGFFGLQLASMDNPWLPHYESTSWQPYGMRLAHDVLEESVDEFDRLEGNWTTDRLKEAGQGDMMVFMHRHPGFWPESHQKAILDFVARGGVLLMATQQESPGHALLPSILRQRRVVFTAPPTAVLLDDDSTPSIDSLRYRSGFVEEPPPSSYDFPILELRNRPGGKPDGHASQGSDAARLIKAGQLEDSTAVFAAPLGYYRALHKAQQAPITRKNSVGYNAFELRVGKGQIAYHTVPLVFTNYYLRRESGFAYLDALISRYQPEHILWDEGSKNPNFFRAPQNSSDINTDSPLSYILQQPALRWAWYTLLAGLLLFLLLSARRRERPVPLLAFRAGQTRNFVSTLAGMSRTREDRQTAGRQRMELFQKDIRERLGVEIEQFDKATHKRLRFEAQVSAEVVEEVARAYEMLMSEDAQNDKHLLRFHHAVDTFYQKSQLWIPRKEKGAPPIASSNALPGGVKP